MDLGLKGKTAIICAASKGLGRGCAEALAAEGVSLVINSRTADAINATAADLRAQYGVDVIAIAADIKTDAGRQQVLEACPNPDILINNAGGPPPGDFKEFSLDDWREAVEGNMITPIAMIQATVYGMMERGFGRIVNITSASVKAPIAAIELSNGARAGLTGGVAALSRKVVHRNVTINGLLPGIHDTDRITTNVALQAKRDGVSEDVIRQRIISANPAQRLGTAEEFGSACAFLCSAHSGFITGQNLVIDGGALNATI